MKWMCTNCNNVFESEDGSEKDEFRDHINDCLEMDDYFKIIEEELK